MSAQKKLAICMDHSYAYIMEFNSKHAEIAAVASRLSKNELLSHDSRENRKLSASEKEQQHTFYKALGDIIKNYKRVILFGPTKAKIELFDLLSEDERFIKIIFEIKNTARMTVHQRVQFVKEYFSKA